jgi:hypothetical protein
LLLFWWVNVFCVFVEFRLCEVWRLIAYVLLVVLPILSDVGLFLLNFSEHLVVQERIIVVVEYVVLVLMDDVHGTQHIQCVIHAALDIFEVDALSFLYKTN